LLKNKATREQTMSNAATVDREEVYAEQPALPAKRTSHLSVVEDAISAAIEGGLVAEAPSAAPVVPLVDPLSEYRAAEERRRLDAEGEINMLDELMNQRRARFDTVLQKIESEYQRSIDAETERFSAEWTSLEEQMGRHRLILAGATASLVAIDHGLR
jgi:hypothetical protein